MKAVGLLLLLLPFCALAQKKSKDTSYIYLNQHLQLVSAKNAVFVGVSIKVEGGWMAFVVYPDTTPLLKAFYKNKQLTVKEGPYTIYHPKNIKAREGFFTNNKMNGLWRFWYPNGQLKDSGRINNNYMTGQWKSWHPNGILQTETTFAEMLATQNSDAWDGLLGMGTRVPYASRREGAHTSWYSNGSKEATGNFQNNLMEGTWYWYHLNGAPATVEEYKNGMLTALQCFDTTGQLTGDMCSIDKPAILKHYGDYKMFVYENLIWPEEARKKKIEGDVVVKFTVGKTGELDSLSITSTEPLLKKAVEDLFAQMKEWYPAISHNRAIEFTDEMIIPFRL